VVKSNNRCWGEVFVWLNIAFYVVLLLFVWFFPPDYLSEFANISFTTEITILGFVIAVIGFCFALIPQPKKNETDEQRRERLNPLYTDKNKLYFIDCLRLVFIDIFVAVFCLLVSEFNAGMVLVLTFTLIQIFFVFHYYFKKLFDGNKPTQWKLKRKSFLRALSLIIPIIAMGVYYIANHHYEFLVHFIFLCVYFSLMFLFNEFVFDNEGEQK